MKKGVVIAALILTVCCGEGGAAILGQLGYDPGGTGRLHKHDFSKNADAGGPRALDETGICVFCHTPHGASAESTLWNRQAPIGPNGDGTFPLYGSASSDLQAADIQPLAQYYNDGTGGVVYPNGASRLCLSCHDGVSAIGGVLNDAEITMESGDETITNPTAIIDLTVAHPISFVYSPAVVTKLNEPLRKTPAGGTYHSPVTPATSPLDGMSRMQCTTCHDPHRDTRLAVGNPTYLPFWRYGTGDPATAYNPVCENCHLGTATDWQAGPGH